MEILSTACIIFLLFRTTTCDLFIGQKLANDLVDACIVNRTSRHGNTRIECLLKCNKDNLKIAYVSNERLCLCLRSSCHGDNKQNVSSKLTKIEMFEKKVIHSTKTGVIIWR